jgi:hypothetical protein
MSINWQDVITSLAVATGGGLVLVGAWAWLIKTAIPHKLATEADTFKTRIKADADIEIERLKSSLQIVATEHQVRFTKLHEKRAEIIADLYKRLVEIHRLGEFFVVTRENNPDPAKEFDKLQREIFEFRRFYEQHQIYLPLNVCRSVESLLGEITGNVWRAEVLREIRNPTVRVVMQSQDAFTQRYAAFEEQIPAARKALEGEFRRMLGVENA